MTEHATLSAAIVAAQRTARAVGKGATNSFHRYKYASGEDVIGVAKEAMGEHGLAFVVREYIIEQLEPHDMLCADYLLIHELGERMVIRSSTPIIPEKGRPADKALAAAKTYDLAYTLRGVLALPRVDASELEPDQRDDRDHQPPRRSKQRDAAAKAAKAATAAGLVTEDEGRIAAAQAAVKLEVARLGRDRVQAVAKGLHAEPRQQWTADMWEALVAELQHEQPQQGVAS